MKKLVLLGGLLAAAVGTPRAALACDECQLKKEGTYLGQFTIMGNGTVRTWVKYDKTKRPTALGVTFSETALDGLREDLPKQMPVMEYKLALPKEAAITGFDHVSLDWNPFGHAPQGIYTAPHFDVHFYLMTPQERSKITAVGKDLAVTEKKPEARFMPKGYIIPPESAVPQMGAHAVDTATPELRGGPFTSTFIYGYYNGRMTFVEPMIATAFLKTKTNFSAPVKQPAAYPRRGYYPTRYSVTYDAKRQEYSVALEGLVLRAGVGTPKKAAVVASR